VSKVARLWLKQNKKRSGVNLTGEQNSKSVEDGDFEGSEKITDKL